MENLFVLTIKNGDKSVNIGFPCKDSVLEEKLTSIGAQGKQKHFVDKLYDGDKAMRILQKGEFNLDEVNYLAERMAGLNRLELQSFYAVLSVDKSLSMTGIINQVCNMESVTLIEDISNLEKVGARHYMTLHDCMLEGTESVVKAKYKKIGKQLLESGRGIATAYGLIFRNNEIERTIEYNGKTFPQFYKGDAVMSVGLKYNGNEDFVYFPCEELSFSIKKALQRLGAPSVDVCEKSVEIIEISNGEVLKLFEDFALNDDLYEVNELMEKFDEGEDEKLLAVVKYANDASIETVNILLDNLQKFEYIPDVEDVREVGQCVMNAVRGYTSPKEMEPFLDYGGYGQYIKDTYYGKFVEDGFVYLPNGETLEEILGLEEQAPKLEEM